LLRNAQKRDKKKSNQTTEGERKKTKIKPHFVMSPDGFFRILFFVFLNSPCYETPKKTRLKKLIKNKNKNKTEQLTTFVLALQQMYVTFAILFRTAPLAAAVRYALSICCSYIDCRYPQPQWPNPGRSFAFTSTRNARPHVYRVHKRGRWVRCGASKTAALPPFLQLAQGQP
jgi:hypothetical protein